MNRSCIARCFVKTLLVIGCTVFFIRHSAAQRYESIPFGDFEQWMTREIKESVLIGGKTKTIYAVAPDSVVKGAKPYKPTTSPWSTSNALAVIAGIVKASGTVAPYERSQGNRCAYLVSTFDSCKALGLVNIKVLISGTLFLGETTEPIRGVSDPYSRISVGIPFTKRPRALIFDYKAVIPSTGIIVRSTGFAHDEWKGEDPAMVYVYLQNRTEHPDGSITATRVGTTYERFAQSSNGWINKHRMEIQYGDITSTPYYRPYMKLNTHMYGRNSKGKNVPIKEVGWGAKETPVTHVLLYVSTGSLEAFVGAVGNEMWVDNFAFEY